MGRLTNSLDINIVVTLPDDTEATFDMTIPAELYTVDEWPMVLTDVFGRVPRAISRQFPPTTGKNERA